MQAQKKATVTVALLIRLCETDSGGDADRSRMVEKEIDSVSFGGFSRQGPGKQRGSSHFNINMPRWFSVGNTISCFSVFTPLAFVRTVTSNQLVTYP